MQSYRYMYIFTNYTTVSLVQCQPVKSTNTEPKFALRLQLRRG